MTDTLEKRIPKADDMPADFILKNSSTNYYSDPTISARRRVDYSKGGMIWDAAGKTHEAVTVVAYQITSESEMQSWWAGEVDDAMAGMGYTFISADRCYSYTSFAYDGNTYFKHELYMKMDADLQTVHVTYFTGSNYACNSYYAIPQWLMDIYDDIYTGAYGETSETPGCMDPEAENYDPEATIDDDSCVYGNGGVTEIPGCMDPEAENYDPDANVDDGSCIYSTCDKDADCPDGYICINGDCIEVIGGGGNGDVIGDDMISSVMTLMMVVMMMGMMMSMMGRTAQ